MTTKIWLSDRQAVVDPADATISVFDRGFLYGDSVYETMRTVGALHVLEYERHLERLERSAAGIGLELEHSRTDIRAAVRQSIEAAKNPESRIRVVVTRGTGPISIDTRKSEDPLLVVFVERLELIAPERYAQGIRACLIRGGGSSTWRAGLKTGNYLPNILALKHAVENQGDDAIMCNAEGAVAEGATSNVFAVMNDVLVTPHLEAGVLAGITRSLTLELAEAIGIAVQERRVMPEELASASEIFLTSSVRGLMPVTMLDGVAVGNGQPGPVTKRMLDAYAKYLQKEALDRPNNLVRPPT